KLNNYFFTVVREAIATTHATKAALTEGLIVLHASRPSTVSDHVTDEKDYEQGGWSNVSEVTDQKKARGLAKDAFKKIGLVYLMTPDKTADTHKFKGTGKVPKEAFAIALHEIGHALWLPHVRSSRSGMPAADNPKPSEHVQGGVCIMSYDNGTNQ